LLNARRHVSRIRNPSDGFQHLLTRQRPGSAAALRGLPCTERSGTIAASCFLVSGCASGSALAAARIFAFSFSEGIRMTRLEVAFGIVFDLIALGISETNVRAQLRREADSAAATS
jgi:hypothetical protein